MPRWVERSCRVRSMPTPGGWHMRAAVALALLGNLAHAAPATAVAAAAPAGLADCAGIADAGSRLACYDRLAAGAAIERDTVERDVSEAAKTAPVAPDGTPAQAARTAPAAQEPGTRDSVAAFPPASEQQTAEFSLSSHWEVGRENKRGIFAFRPHRPNYIIANYNSSPNNTPYLPFRRITPDGNGLSHGELVFQLGFKMKGAENLLDTPADLWFGYTQESFWQAGNHDASSPFRESNYQPEMMLVMPADFALLGMRARFVNFGLVHQSNGQTSTLSRSWNRVYAQLGLERGNFTVLARAWKRLNEDAATDDNPDINDFLGYGDLLGTYRRNGHEWSLLARRNFRTGHGALQAGWAFPLAGQLKGYVQLFTGYGQSLIDYKHAHKSLGLGLMVSY